MSRQPMLKLFSAVAVALLALTACTRTSNGDLVPSEASFEVTLRAEGPGRQVLDEFQVDCSEVCTIDAAPGTILVPETVPEAGARFARWDGACSGTGSCTVLVDSRVEIVAVFADDSGSANDDGTTDQDDSDGVDDDQDATTPGNEPGLDGTYFVSIELAGPGGGKIEVPGRDFVCSSECSLNTPPGETIELIAVADGDSFFSGWTGDCEGANEVCSIIVNDDLETDVRFRLDAQPFLLFVDPVPDGGTVRSGEIDCGDDSQVCSSDHRSGDTIELVAEPAQGLDFLEWTGDCAGRQGLTCELTIDGDRRASARFAAQEPVHELTVNVEGNGMGEVVFPDGERCNSLETCDQHFPEGTEVSLEAVSDSGAYVDGWEGAECEPHAWTCTILVDGDRTVTVSFHTNDLQYWLMIEEPAGGTIVSDKLSCGDEGDNCDREQGFDYVVELQAIPSDGFDFVSWEGDCSHSETPVCELTFRDDKVVGASFRAE